MYTLRQSLQDEDLGRLKIIAEIWGIDLPESKQGDALEHLLTAMLNPELVLEIVSSLSQKASGALNELLVRKSRIPFSDFNREFGPIREMGPGRRDREKPWRSSVSPLEQLWYRGLAARTFLHGPRGHMEYIVVPDDLSELLPSSRPITRGSAGTPMPEPSRQGEPSHDLIEDLITTLGFLRMHPSVSITEATTELAPFIAQQGSVPLLITLLLEEGILLPSPLRVDPDQVRTFLELSQTGIQQRMLFAWQTSTRWNDLAHVPGLDYPEEAWPNDPIASREGILSAISAVPPETWWGLPSLVDAIKDSNPSFQRPAGDFDSWYIRRVGSDQFLRGFEHWDKVEGALIHFVLNGPLYWLGMVARSRDEANASSPAAFHVLKVLVIGGENAAQPEKADQHEPAILNSSGEIIAPRGMHPHARYQLSRCASWHSLDRRGYRYRITPSALKAASDQGLEVRHILAILTLAGERPLAPSLTNAIKRWSVQGPEAGLEHVLILRVARSEILDELRKNKSTSRYIAERLGPTTAVVLKSAWPKLLKTATENRILIEPPPEIKSV